MQQWNGLFKKEWFLMRNWFLGIIGAGAFSILLLPYGSSLFFKGSDVLEMMFGMSILWSIMSLFIPTILLLKSIGNEMQRADTWLHSTASMYQLIGVKMVFSALLGLLNSVMAIVTAYISSSAGAGFTLLSFIKLGGGLTIFLYTVSISIMCIGLLLGAIFQVIKPVVKEFSWIVITLLFMAGVWLVGKITSSTLYQKIGEIGPKWEHEMDGFRLEKGSLSMELDRFSISTGDLAMEFVFAIIFFISAVLLFEKKVRL